MKTDSTKATTALKENKIMPELKFQYTQEERLKILQFARSIVPPNWNIFTDGWGWQFPLKRGAVNILLEFPDCEALYKTSDPSFVGFAAYVHGGLSMFDGIQDSIRLTLQTPWKRDWRGLIMHELAHIAVYRWVFYSTKAHMEWMELETPDGLDFRQYGTIYSSQPPAHGKIFKRALSIMRSRARRRVKDTRP
jgi:hypothetical protein